MNYPSSQKGLSLIELLIGMMLSLLAVIAMLALARTATHTASESKFGVQTEGQMATGLLSADKLLKSAGYFAVASGPTPSYPADLVLVENALVAASGNSGTAMSSVPASGSVISPAAGSGQAILWRNRDSMGNYAYQGLYAPASGGVWRITGNSMSIGGWVMREALLQSPDIGSSQLRNAGVATFSLRHESTPCRPYGIAVAGGRYSVILSTQTYSGQQILNSETCLVNFP